MNPAPRKIPRLVLWTATAVLTLAVRAADRSIADFSAAPPAPRPAAVTAGRAAPIRSRLPERETVASEHGRIESVPGGRRCTFVQAPFIEATGDLARAWGVPVAYFGPLALVTDATFTASTPAAALLRLADRTQLRVVRCGSGWSLEEMLETEELGLVSPPQTPDHRAAF